MRVQNAGEAGRVAAVGDQSREVKDELETVSYLFL